MKHNTSVIGGLIVIPDLIGNPEKSLACGRAGNAGFPMEFIPCFDTGRE
ncbi:MAG: hypothetical protein HYV36_05840 [Lentisphaerae bacterium]|nr:hypothetical protein [Lentisphaerota bacterium]